MKKNILITVIIAISAVVLCGCSSTSRQLKGQWFEEHGYMQLSIDKDCEVTYYMSGPVGVSKNFEYKLTDDGLILITDDGKETLIALTFSEEKNTLESLEYYADDKKIVFTKTEAEPASVNYDLLTAMNESVIQANELKEEGKNAEALSAFFGFADEKESYDSINAFLESLNDFQLES